MILLIASFAIFLAACSVRMQPTPAPALRLADDLDRESLRGAIRRSLEYLDKLPPDRIIGEQPRPLTVRQVSDTLSAFEKLLEVWDCVVCWARSVEESFDFYPAASPELDDVLFTGYFQPVIDASLTESGEYRYALYGKPGDLVVAEQVTVFPSISIEKIVGRVHDDGFVPYYSRREIDHSGFLRGKGYEIAWVKDPIDLFFLHIQGSGILRLEDNRYLHVGYAASNGRPYRSIGRLLIDNGNIPKEEMSMQRLRRYLAEHPAERDEIMAYNESYVFFRFVKDGPLGSLEFPLTDGRSIATDARLFPKGALAFIVTKKPVLDPAGQLLGWQPFSRFVLNQDTGGAIRGLRRVDLFFGTGEQAGAAAGVMNTMGKLYFLSLKTEGSGAAAVGTHANPP
jgi:membrane-bound lytic murein transglycosylase A